MWYLWRAGPGDRVGQYVSSFPSLGAVRRVVVDIAGSADKKLVTRRVEDGIQFIVKDRSTTLEALVRAVTYYAKQKKETPVVKPMDIRWKGRPVEPGGKLPSPYLKVNP